MILVRVEVHEARCGLERQKHACAMVPLECVLASASAYALSNAVSSVSVDPTRDANGRLFECEIW